MKASSAAKAVAPSEPVDPAVGGLPASQRARRPARGRGRASSKPSELPEQAIRWELEPVQRPEEIDVLGMSFLELPAHIDLLRAELRAVRLVLSVAMSKNAHLEAACTRAYEQLWEKKKTGQQVR